jgi:hypothetical protein
MKIKYTNPQPAALPTFRDLEVGDVFTLTPGDDALLFIKMPPIFENVDGTHEVGKPQTKANTFCFDDNEFSWTNDDDRVYVRNVEVVVLD